MRSKSRSVLRDVTPGNTPKSKRTASKATKAKQQLLGSSPGRLPALDLSDARNDDVLPSAPLLKRTSSAGPPKRIPVMPLQTTPLANKRHAAAPSQGKSRTRVPLSPLPPSSPPSEVSELYDDNAENRPPLAEWFEDNEEPLEEIAEEDEEEVVETLEAHSNPAPANAASSSSDDPFGFSTLERRLKVEREVRLRAGMIDMPHPHPRDKGKAVARPPRAPFGELPLEEHGPPLSTSAAIRRAPTPYHPSDDLEDMYLDTTQQPSAQYSDVDPETQRTLVARRTVEDDTQRTYVEGPGDAEEPVHTEEYSVPEPPSDEEALVMPPTPKPQHVAYMPGLASPFSSREGTPCDRSLVESPLSSPSPTKPLTVHRYLTFSSPGKTSGRPRPLTETPMKTPLTFNRLKPDMSQMGTSSPLRARSTVKKGSMMKYVADDERTSSEDPLAVARNLEKLLPKRPFRRSALATSSLPPDASPLPKAKTSKGKGKEVIRPPPRTRAASRRSEEVEYSGSETELPSPSSPIQPRKRKAPVKQFRPAKRMKVEVVITRRPPPPESKPSRTRAKAGTTRKRATRAKPPSKPKSKGKGKTREGTAKVGDEDSVGTRFSFPGTE